ncbi:MAG: DNA primase [Phycisphaerae bacterium]|nr:DNA primase [Phycisphaerae bacterium]
MSNDIQRVRDAVDLVALINEYVPLQPKGREWVGVCPFHDDNRPSMSVVTHRENAFYHCFSCGATGSCFTFLEKYLNMSFGEALRMLAEREGIELEGRTKQQEEAVSTKRVLQDVANWAKQKYVTTLQDSAEGKQAIDILNGRGFSEETIQKFELGVAPDAWDFIAANLRGNDARIQKAKDVGLLKEKQSGHETHVYDTFRNRIMFPIWDAFGKTIAFGARRINEEAEPKYLNSPETELFHKSKTLYGMHLAQKSIRDAKLAIVVEGYTDVIACHQAGVEHVVGTLGTAFTKEHATMLSRLCNEVVLVFDGDASGQKAADRAIDIFFNTPVDVRVCVLPEGKDPADVATDKASFEGFVESATDALTYKLNRLQLELDGETTTTGQTTVVHAFLQSLAQLGFDSMSGLRKRFVYERLGQLLSMPMTDVEQLMNAQLPNRPAAVTPTNQSVSEPAPIAIGNVSTKRQKAEQELIGVCLYDPNEASGVLRETERKITTEDFVDPLSNTVVSLILPKLMTGLTFTMPEILDELNPELRSEASLLFFHGERLCENEGSVMSAMNTSLKAFFDTIDQRALTQEIKNIKQVEDPVEKAKAAQQAIEAMRKKKIKSVS